MTPALGRIHRSGRTTAALSRLDDRLLRDIGLTRDAISGLARELAHRRHGEDRR